MKRLIYLMLLTITTGLAATAARAETTFSSTLAGSPGSSAKCFGRLTLDDSETQLNVYLDFSGLAGNEVGTVIRNAPFPGGVGPVVFTLGATGSTSGSFINQFAVTAQQVADLKAGKWYFDLNTTNSLDNRRGTIKIYAPFVANITPAQAIPPTVTTATAFCRLIISDANNQISSTLTFSGIDPNDVTAFLYVGARAGQTGGTFVGQLTRTANQLIDITPAQAALIRSGQAYVNVFNQSFPTGLLRGQLVRSGKDWPDFDGDGRADYSVFRSSDTVWYNLTTSGTASFRQWGLSTDTPVPEDYDGDGKTDIAVWRSGPAGQAAFYILNSADNSFRAELFGQTGDLPQVVGDYDGDGKADLAVYRYDVVGSQSYYFYRGSAGNPQGSITFVPWGNDFDIPLPGDFNGDGRKDFAVLRTTDSTWYVLPNGNPSGWFAEQFGDFNSDFFVPADYDGDGQTDIAVFRPLARVWYIQQSSTGTIRYAYFGIAGDKPVVADYDGDGKADVAVWRFSDGNFYSLGSGNTFSAVHWGMQGDYPVARIQSFPF
ncbi:MAG: CHRD domain-containing protein [Acidobacteria bacterium]|nr:CHRD domain-containing protein [Acidobacteriota bacterium]